MDCSTWVGGTPLARGRLAPLGRLAAMTLVLSLAAAPGPAAGQERVRPGASEASDEVSVPAPYPRLETGRDLALLAVGVGFLGASRLVPEPVRALPSSGLDPGDIPWSFDRRAVGPIDYDAERASDWTRNGALALPLVLGWLHAGDDRWSSFSRTSVVFAETVLITGGLTRFGKAVFGRARPFAYLPEHQRPPDAATAVPSAGTFYSLPSGHSSLAWASASVALTEHLLLRPHAHWTENMGVGFVGGALAGATAALRVAAGFHFTSDVVAGAGLGIVTGVAVPLAHRGDQPLPTSGAWLEVAGGALAGTLVGVVLAGTY
jgi:membrane-associated phospholipid phosphatase